MMATSRVVHDDHPMKVHADAFAADGTLRAEDGWVNMNVKFLITRDTVQAERTVFGITIFPPGAMHDIHRHPNAEETEYIVEGNGVARVGADDVAMGPGDVVFVKANDEHGFHNTSETERAVMVWCYGGAASLSEAGYVRAEEPSQEERS
jgi:quercetin dioxygenase-like cupin family protein